MSMAGLTNNTAYLYRFTKGSTYPFTKTWTVAETIPCYVSDATLKKVLSDGSLIDVKIRRVRTAPYTYVVGDRVYIDSKIYETLSYENFDGLSMEAVTVCKILDDTFITDMGIV